MVKWVTVERESEDHFEPCWVLCFSRWLRGPLSALRFCTRFVRCVFAGQSSNTQSFWRRPTETAMGDLWSGKIIIHFSALCQYSFNMFLARSSAVALHAGEGTSPENGIDYSEVFVGWKMLKIWLTKGEWRRWGPRRIINPLTSWTMLNVRNLSSLAMEDPGPEERMFHIWRTWVEIWHWLCTFSAHS